MIWESLINRSLETNQIIETISKLFSISPEIILVTEDICELNLKLDDRIKILCEKSKVEGDFFTKLSIYFRSPEFNNLDFNEQQFFGRFCHILQCQCLISDNSFNPYSMVLVEDIDQYRTIYLNEEYLDREKYIIANSSS